MIAAGNADFDFTYDPWHSSEYPIKVMAHDKNRNKASFSNYTNTEDHCIISAPGTTTSDVEGLYSLKEGGEIVDHQGTSMAAPIVASAIALMLSQDDDLTPQEIRDIINSENDKVKIYNGIDAPILNIESLLNKTQQPM